MILLRRRRRPLMRAAVVGGGAYAMGKNAGRASEQNEAQEDRINELEELSQGIKGGASTAGDDLSAKLKQLSDLKNSGELSDEEYRTAKQKLLS